MKQSTTLLALVSLIVFIVWGCSDSAEPNPTTSGGNGTTTTQGTPSTVTGGTVTGTSTGTSTTGGTACVAPQVDCGGACANTMTDPANCGGCNMACAAHLSCNLGSCACAAGGLDCGAACVDSMTDAAHCGGCNMACGTGAVCMTGACMCQAGLMDCSGTCADVQSDVNNCGGCGVACGAQVCSLGACADSCAEGLENCSGSCVNLQTSAANCGACGTACAGGLSCTNGACECPGGQTSCGGACVDTMTNAANCGECGNACPATATCLAGACQCPDGQEACGASCVPTGTCTASDCANANSLMISDFEGDPTAALEVTGDAGQFTGLWEDFNDGTGTQTLAVEAVTDAECGNQALHTTGSNFSDWGVGIGFSLSGMPEAPSVYDASAWTGIRFKAKIGGSTTPVRFNISIPASEGIDSGGSCDPATVDDGCYNHPGRFLEGSYAASTTWRTYHFCFDRDLYPQFLPSSLSNAQRSTVSSNILKMQFIFNKAIDPNNPNIDDDPNGGLFPMSTAFDFWVDDIEFTNDPCPDNTFEGTGSVAFPQNEQPGSCTLVPNVEAYNSNISEYYEEWKTRFLRNDGGVFSPEDNRVISEGMGYGMLLAASFGDKAAFDSMWGYVSPGRLSGGLMTWTDGGSGSATDGDADIAYALLLAGAQWGGDYTSAGTAMISAMSSLDVTGNRINPGSNWGSQDVYNPSYFTPAYYGEFGGNWGSTILGEGYTILDRCEDGFMQANDNGLVPDWCNPTSGAPLHGGNTAQVTSTLCDDACNHYAFDAARVPWRIGVDACLNNRSQATTYLNQLIGHFVSLHTAERIDLMRSGYRSSDGQAHANSQAMQGSFIGPVGVGAMAVNQTVYQRAFRAVMDILRDTRFNRTYYPTTVGLLTLLEMTGNLPHHAVQ